jgi:hypothetical protein
MIINPDDLRKEYSDADSEARKLVLTALLAHKEGRRFIWWLLQIGKAIGAQPYSQGDPHQTSFSCGEMQVGNKILAELIHADGEAYLKMMLEMQRDHTRRNDAIRSATRNAATGGR